MDFPLVCLRNFWITIFVCLFYSDNKANPRCLVFSRPLYPYPQLRKINSLCLCFPSLYCSWNTSSHSNRECCSFPVSQKAVPLLPNIQNHLENCWFLCFVQLLTCLRREDISVPCYSNLTKGRGR